MAKPEEPVPSEVKLFHGYVESNIKNNPAAQEKIKGKNVLMTGVSTEMGIGYAVVRVFCEFGCKSMVLAVRDAQKAERRVVPKLVSDGIFSSEEEAKKVVKIIGPCDHMSFDSIRELCGVNKQGERSGSSAIANALPSGDLIDYLFLNAGVMANPYTKSKDGHDIQIQTNVLSHFLLQKSLISASLLAGDATIISTSSFVWGYGNWLDLKTDFKYYEPGWRHMGISHWKRYFQSKQGNMVHFIESARREEEQNATNRRHVGAQPGLCNSYLQVEQGNGYINRWNESQSPLDGGLNLIHAALFAKSGEFVSPKERQVGEPQLFVIPEPDMYKPEIGKKFWEQCDRLVDA